MARNPAPSSTRARPESSVRARLKYGSASSPRSVRISRLPWWNSDSDSVTGWIAAFMAGAALSSVKVTTVRFGVRTLIHLSFARTAVDTSAAQSRTAAAARVVMALSLADSALQILMRGGDLVVSEMREPPSGGPAHEVERLAADGHAFAKQAGERRQRVSADHDQVGRDDRPFLLSTQVWSVAFRAVRVRDVVAEGHWLLRLDGRRAHGVVVDHRRDGLELTRHEPQPPEGHDLELRVEARLVRRLPQKGQNRSEIGVAHALEHIRRHREDACPVRPHPVAHDARALPIAEG